MWAKTETEKDILGIFVANSEGKYGIELIIEKN